jgi:hypothetical protein
VKLEARIEKLESSMADQIREEYEERATFRNHVTYCILEDGRVVTFEADLSLWPNECTLWKAYSTGTKFLRLDAVDAHEVVDSVSKLVRFVPIKETPGAHRALAELYRDITGEWPRAKETKS